MVGFQHLRVVGFPHLCCQSMYLLCYNGDSIEMLKFFLPRVVKAVNAASPQAFKQCLDSTALTVVLL